MQLHTIFVVTFDTTSHDRVKDTTFVVTFVTTFVVTFVTTFVVTFVTTFVVTFVTTSQDEPLIRMRIQ